MSCYCCECRDSDYRAGCDCGLDACAKCLLCVRHCDCPDKPQPAFGTPLPHWKFLDEAIRQGVAEVGYGDDSDAVFGIAFADPSDDAPAREAANPRFLERW